MLDLNRLRKKSEILKKKVRSFHQASLGGRTRFDIDRSRTAVTRTTTGKGSKKLKMLFLKQNDQKL